MLRRFLNLVPAPIRTSAFIVVVCGTLLGLFAGLFSRTIQHLPSDPVPIVRNSAAGLCAGLFLGAVIAIWLLCLGYVYADARQRAMRPALWVVIAAVFPNLLGFLLYFALRQPIPSTCRSCGRSMPSGQRFCSSCGAEQAPQVSPFTASAVSPGQPASQ